MENTFTLTVSEVNEERTVSLKRKKKPFRIIIKPKNKYIKDLKVGFDEIPDKFIVKSDYEALKKEYTSVNEQTLKASDFLQSDEEYIPNWISMRTGDTNKVELDLDWKPDGFLGIIGRAERKARAYEKIEFEQHDDFIIEPLNLKKEDGDVVDTVTITCKTNNNKPAVLKIKADGELVGAINVFYPKPKTVKINWVIAKFNRNDIKKIKGNYNALILQQYLKKAFAPALIDIIINNAAPYEVNIPDLEENKDAQTSVQKKTDKKIKHIIAEMREHMDGATKIKSTKFDKTQFLIKLYQITQINNNITNMDTIILILTNLKCTYTDDAGAPHSTNGITLTDNGISAMIFGNKQTSPSIEIPHELMHALGLQHTFNKEGEAAGEFKHLLYKGTTDNYMDYTDNSKKTYKWQWDKLFKSRYSHEK